jgi:hypothetical protein
MGAFSGTFGLIVFLTIFFAFVFLIVYLLGKMGL